MFFGVDLLTLMLTQKIFLSDENNTRLMLEDQSGLLFEGCTRFEPVFLSLHFSAFPSYTNTLTKLMSEAHGNRTRITTLESGMFPYYISASGF